MVKNLEMAWIGIYCLGVAIGNALKYLLTLALVGFCVVGFLILPELLCNLLGI